MSAVLAVLNNRLSSSAAKKMVAGRRPNQRPETGVRAGTGRPSNRAISDSVAHVMAGRGLPAGIQE